MNTKIKKKWVQWLQEGHLQGRHTLLSTSNGTSNAYCCLGGLCEVMGVKRTRFEGLVFPASKITKKAGIKNKDVYALASLNDWTTHDYSQVPFEMIAGLIDEAL